MILLGHPTGNASIRNAALAFEQAGWLGEFWTALAWSKGTLLDRALPAALRRQLARRSFAEVPPRRLHTAPAREWGRFVAPRLGLGWMTRHERGLFSVDGVYGSFDRAVARRLRRRPGAVRAVYVGEDYAWASFRAATELKLRRIYDLPIGYWRAARAVLAEEAVREPAWAATLTGLQDSPAKLLRKDQELAMAELVIVASSFTRHTLEASPVPHPPVAVVPYGAPPPLPELPARRAGGKLRVLFAGSLGQRKGLSYLLAAMSALKGEAELTLLGRKTAEDCAPLNEAVARHRWIPTLPHAELLAEMATHDVLVFPSLFEGFGLVITEALSQGIPVIATAHTAAPDLLTEGVDGFVVPIRSSAAIAEKLALLAGDRARLQAMKEAALAKSAALGWSGFRDTLCAAVGELLEPSALAVH